MMKRFTLPFLIIAVVAGIYGFGGFDLWATEAARIVFLVAADLFVFEMPLIAFMERKGWNQIANVIGGFIFTALSFGFFYLMGWNGFLVIGMIVVTLGEMIAFPFGNAFALRRAKLGRQGAYMGLYSMSFSLAHIFGHNSGMQLVNAFGYNKTWLVMVAISLAGILLLLYVKKKSLKIKI